MLTIEKVVFFLYCLFIILTPFYVFGSGLPQPADIVLAIAGMLMFIKVPKTIFRKEPVNILVLFVVLVFIVNFLNQLELNYINVSGRMWITSLFYLFNLFAFVLGFFILSKGSKVKKINILAVVLFSSVAIQCVCGLIGIGNTGGRYSIFFNNPNQLGYYSLCSITFFTVLPSKLRSNIFFVLLMVLMCSYLVLLSESRAALGGIIILTIIIFLLEGSKFNIKTLAILVLALFAFLFFLEKTTFFSNQFSKIKTRNENKTTTLDKEIQIRGYDRIFIYSEYLWYGAGEGGERRFTKAFHQGEIHSGFGTVLFSYGILGLILFILFLFKIIKLNFIFNLFVMFPIFIYNFTHMGIRESLFWMILSFIVINSIQVRRGRIFKNSSGFLLGH